MCQHNHLTRLAGEYHGQPGYQCETCKEIFTVTIVPYVVGIQVKEPAQ